MNDDDLAEIRERLTSIEEMVGDIRTALGVPARADRPRTASAPPVAHSVEVVPPLDRGRQSVVPPAMPTVPERTVPAAAPAHPRPAAPPPKPTLGSPATPAPSAPVTEVDSTTRSSHPQKPTQTTEQWLGGKGLALVGGLAVLIGIVFFVAVAIRNGMFPPSLRMILAAVGSAGLVVVADRLSRRGIDRTLVGVLTVVGVLGGFATMLGSINHFRLIPEGSSLVIAPLIGAVAVWCGHRFGLRFMVPGGGVLSLIGPMSCGIDPSLGLSMYVFGAFVILSALALRFRWVELWPIGVVGVALAWAPWLADEWYDFSSAGAGLVALSVMLAANVAIAVAGDVHWTPKTSPTPLSIPTLPAVTAGVAVAGVVLLDRFSDTETPKDLWVTVLAVGMLVAGLSLYARTRARLMGPFVAAIGFALSAVAIGMWFDGPGRTIGWAAQAVVAAWAARAIDDDPPMFGTFAAIAMATAGALKLCPARGLGWDPVPWQGVVAVGAVAIGAAAAAWLSFGVSERLIRIDGHRSHLLVALAGAATWYGGSVTIVQMLGIDHDSTQVVLSVVWAIVGLAMIVVGLRRDLRLIRVVGLGLLGLALAKLVLFDLRYLESTSRALSFILVGLLALGGAYAYQRILSQIGPGPQDGHAKEDADTRTDPPAG